MISLNAEVENVDALLKDLRVFRKKLGMQAKDVMRTAGHSIARAAMQFTQPFGLKTDAKKLGEMAIKVDALRALRNPLPWTFKNQPPPDQGAAEQHLDSQRNKRGRVPKNAAWIHTEDRTIDAIIAKRQALVGKSKAAWAHAGLKIGMKRVPKWISRHPNNRAFARIGKSNTHPYVEIGSNIPFASRVFSEANQRKALQAGMRNAIRFLRRKAELPVKEFNRKR